MLNNRLKKLENMLSRQGEENSVVMIIECGDSLFYSDEEREEFIQNANGPVIEINEHKVEQWRLLKQSKT